jgi:hypothetical protein
MKRIRVERTAYRDTYTIGKMSVCEDGAWSYMCDTLEDRYRANGMKVKGSTAIPKEYVQGCGGLLVSVQEDDAAHLECSYVFGNTNPLWQYCC